MEALAVLRERLRSHTLLAEPEAARRLRAALTLDAAQREAAAAAAARLVDGTRARAGEQTCFDSFMQEFGLSNEEGVALLCLAEALLRIPDDATADRFIAERLAAGDWAAHHGDSGSAFVNASTWGLMLAARLVELDPGVRQDAGGWLQGLARRIGEPLARAALRRAMHVLGGEFVVGRDIEAALARSAREPSLALCSFDMLGEGARTATDAARHHAACRQAIEALGAATTPGAKPHAISIKLSALEPRLAPLQAGRVQARLVPRALELARLAAGRGIALTIDAEEAERLDLALGVTEALASDTATAGWEGLGVVVQAYGRRALDLVDWLAALAAEHGRRIAVRLVKGAYWDTEIKRAQERGLDDYPVFTRKLVTDVAWLACAARLFGAGGYLSPQFATHNAHSIAAALELRPRGAPCEFQRLHGMGRLLYDEAARQFADFPAVRVYAPVGAHEDLLPYLVRRLLENGANGSFVNRLLDSRVPAEVLTRDPVAPFDRLLAAADGAAIANPALPRPPELFRNADGELARRNSHGLDFGNPLQVAALQAELAAARTSRERRLDTEFPANAARRAHPGEARREIRNPADRTERIGVVTDATPAAIDAAFTRAAGAFRDWNGAGAAARASCLERAAERFERERARFVDLLVREAGRTLPNALGELREAIDLCRYYALEARRGIAAPQRLPGPTGERNDLSLQGRGVFACISPWNFPLAIFTGQVAAALVAGNAVIAKPAEATPLVALAACEVLHDSGVPRAVLQCLPCGGAAFGAVAWRHLALAGVALTGSTATAQRINRELALRDGPILPLIAETGGINAMLVDSTALPEQVVDDVIVSAFDSAGQRCSALRLLCLQEDIADRVLEMLRGAMDELVIGDPARLETDVGPVISDAAAESLARHLASLPPAARLLHRLVPGSDCDRGSFVGPSLVELEHPGQLREEAFGPVLHVVRWRPPQWQALLAALRDGGHALTLGVQTRLDATWREAFAATQVGNVYVNRSMIGAVVGVQPFGGNGLSGTGPKAGGPHYLPRFALERTLTVNETATGGNVELLRTLDRGDS